MSDTIGDFRIGEDIVVALDSISGGTAATVTAKLVLAHWFNGKLIINDDATPIAMTVTSREASGDIPAGWTLTLLAAASINLEVGFYGIDARIVVGSGVNITDQTAFIELTKAAIQ